MNGTQLLDGSWSGPGVASTTFSGLRFESHARLDVARSFEGQRFRFDEGRGALVLVALAVVLLSSLQAYLRRAAHAAAGSPDEGASAASAAVPASQRQFKSRDAAMASASRGAPARPEEGGVVRCPKCYGKYQVEREPVCPHCGAERPGAVAPSAAAPAAPRERAEPRRDQPDAAPTRFQDAERLNDEAVEILKKIRTVFRVDDAVKKFSLAIQRAPKNPTYHSNRGVAHLTNARRRFAMVGDLADSTVQRDLDRARADFLEAIALSGRHANYHALLAQLDEFIGDLESARSGYQTALELDPNLTAASDGVTRIAAEAERNVALPARERLDALIAEASRRAASGDLGGALDVVDGALRIDETSAKALLTKADLLNRLNRMEESVEVARRAIDASNREIQSLVASYQAKGLYTAVLPTVGDDAELGLGPASVGSGLSPARGAAASGSLAELGLPDLLQVLGAGQKTVRVTMQQGGSMGVVELERGQIVHAELGGRSGEEAFYRLVTWSDGQFRIDPLIDVVSRTIQGSNDALILEGLRRLDEAVYEASGRSRPDG